ncbi:MAG: orotate phosphoribosyltransferase [Acidobacteriia bacterium]|nr:orotate phosphoribosyltransferase [Terriglobia bacterium]
MTEAEIITLFRESQALLEGHFQLSSGRHSDQYFQCALVLQDPEAASRLGTALARCFKTPREISAVVAPALGGILVAHEVARALHVRSLFTERVNGQMTLRRGFSLRSGSRAVVVEDVITTGLSTLETVRAVEATGASVVALGALVDRSGGSVSSQFTIPLHSLLTMEAKSYLPAECPLCAKRIPIVKPGSRS